MMRFGCVIALAGLACLSLSSCEQNTRGGIAVSNDGGSLSVRFSICGDPVSVIRLDPAESTGDEPLGKIRLATPDASPVVGLSINGAGSATTLSLAGRSDRVILSAGAESASTPYFIFSRKDLEGLKPGEMLVESPPAEVPVTVPVGPIPQVGC